MGLQKENMFLEIIINDIKKSAEEISAGVLWYVHVQSISVSYELLKFVLNILSPLIVAYLVHKLKKNYWEIDRPFFKNIIQDLKKLFK